METTKKLQKKLVSGYAILKYIRGNKWKYITGVYSDEYYVCDGLSKFHLYESLAEAEKDLLRIGDEHDIYKIEKVCIIKKGS